LVPNQIDTVGSGGAQPDDEPDDEEPDLEDEVDDDDVEDHEDEEYDQVEDEEGDGDFDANGGVAGAGGIDEDQEADDAGMDEDEEGGENGQDEGHDDEGVLNQSEVNLPVGGEANYQPKSSGGMITGGAARGLRTNHH